jgi:hypothetical protein
MNYNISPAHFTAIVDNLTPTKDFNKDAKKLMEIGDMLNKVINYQKWKSCPNLEQELLTVLSEHFNDSNIVLEEVSKILQETRSSFESPSRTDIDVMDYIKKTYTSHIGFVYDINDVVKGKQFMSIIDKIYLYISPLYKKYKKTWEDIEDIYDVVNEHIVKIFNYLDENEDVKKMEEIDETVNSIVSINIKAGYYKDEKELEEDVLAKYKYYLDLHEFSEETKNTIMVGNVKTQIAFYKVSLNLQNTRDLLVSI